VTGDCARIETDHEGTIVAWNRAAERLYGYSADEAIGHVIVDVVIPEQSMREAVEIMDALASGGSWEGEFDVRGRSGELVRVRVHDASRRDASGAFAGIVGYSLPVAAVPPHQVKSDAMRATARWRAALARGMFDPSIAIGWGARGRLIAGGVAAELAWAALTRWAGTDNSIGVAGAVAVMGVLAIAVADLQAGLAVAIIAGCGFEAITACTASSTPFALGLPLIAVWALSAFLVGSAAINLRARAKHGVEEAVTLHRELARALLPPPVRLARTDVSVSTLYRPGEQRLELGGDLFAVTERADQSIALLIGDVSGHGPAAAALAAMLRSSWEVLVGAGVSPQERLQSLNRLVLAHAPGEEFFATVCSIVIHPRLRDATIILAGHPPPILIEAGVAKPIPASSGVPLGVKESAAWLPLQLKLPRWFSLLLYTDGLIEGRVAPLASERFGDARLLEALNSSGNVGAQLLDELMRIASSAHGAALPDDAALLLLEHQAEAVSGSQPRSPLP
jgi:PAS domain S-box-containing protein